MRDGTLRGASAAHGEWGEREIRVTFLLFIER